jgi:hypothetical protein
MRKEKTVSIQETPAAANWLPSWKKRPPHPFLLKE